MAVLTPKSGILFVLTLASEQFCMKMMRFQSYCFQLKNATPVFRKRIRLPENLYQS